MAFDPLKTRALPRLRPLLSIASIICSACLFQGCLNNLSTGSKLNSESLIASTPSSGNDDSASAFILSRIVRSASDPSKFFDLIGDGSGSLGQYCADSDGGFSSCTCTYVYTLSDGNAYTIDTPATYGELNLLRCSYDILPAGIGTLHIKIHLIKDSSGGELDAYSNSLSFNYSSGGTTVDPGNANNFVKVLRHQCRDSVFIPYLLDGKLYDPILSEDNVFSYALNFYTSNMGATIKAFAGNELAKPVNGAGWLCPTRPHDTSSNDLGSSGDANLDLRLYSKGMDSSGSKTIYPVAGNDRHNFWLAKKKAGVFDVAVNAYTAPNTKSSSTTADYLGYAAPSIPTGDDQESCPSSATIPSGYKWAKLWLFRASLATRSYPVSDRIRSINSIGCNPGPIVGSGGNEVSVTDCTYTAAGHAGDNFGLYLNNILAGEYADRVLYNSNNNVAYCARMDLTGGGINLPSPGGSGTYAGTDRWRLAQRDARTLCTRANGTQVVPGSTDDPLSLCLAGAAVATEPRDSGATYSELDTASRWDAVFVVSPTTIMTNDMRKETNAARPYIPYRFRSTDDCPLNSDPDTCDSSGKISYGVELRDITKAEEGSTSGSRVFPLCVLQPTSP